MIDLDREARRCIREGEREGHACWILDLKWRENLVKEREEEELMSYEPIGGEGGEKKRRGEL